MSKVILFGNTGNKNRGCEAIVRSTTKLMKEYTNNVSLATFNYCDDVKCCIETNVTPLRIYSKKTILYYAKILISKIKPFYFFGQKDKYKQIFDISDEKTTFLSIGGDTYCYGNFTSFFSFSHFTKQKKYKNILWCCSLEENLIKGIRKKSLLKYDYIFVREQESFNNLLRKKFPMEKIVKVCDPAFHLDFKETQLPECFSKETIGINISPIVYGKDKKKSTHSIDNLISYILDKTKYNICLIPHVYDAQTSSGDLKSLLEIQNKFEKYGNRISIISEDYNCEELKFIISNCKIMIAARTHASIAAYSTCVPTLVIGYSIKSKGIALDLFGTTNNFLVNYKEIDDESVLVNYFSYINNNFETIKNQLMEILPGYKNLLTNALKHVFNKSNFNICNENYCVGCGVCAELCPSNSITLIENKNGFLEPLINHDTCINCQLCVKKCPQNSLVLPIEKKHVYIAQNKNDYVLKHSSSGGVFYALAASVVNNGGYVFASKFNNLLRLEHSYFKDMTEIKPFLGSKYIQSSMLNIFRFLKKQLELNVLCLFVGTPCQIAAIKSYLGRDYDNLITVDLICHGVPSYLLFDKYIDVKNRKYNINIDKIEFRHKKENKYGVLLNQKYFENAVNDLFFNLYISDFYLRPSCYNCKFKENNHLSDITLGDCWNETPVSFNKNAGGSLVITNTNKGTQIIKSVAADFLTEKINIVDFKPQYSYIYSSPRPILYNKNISNLKKCNITKTHKLYFSSNIFYRAYRFLKKRII